jgi:hypothetical protein
MISSLCIGLATFASSWILHLIIWRIHRPKAYPIWLPIIFMVIPAIVWVALIMMSRLPPSLDFMTVVNGFMLNLAISACYSGGYAGIIEYSPSAEILRAVRKHMPEGVPVDELVVPTISEDALTGKRILHLIQSEMITLNEGIVELTPKGRKVVTICQVYRKIFGMRGEARG